MKKLNSVPIKVIQLKNLNSYTDIKNIFRRAGITRYIYGIKYSGNIIKYGISHKVQEPADRIYTQIGHMPGWKQALLQRSKKKTGKAVNELIQKVDPENFHKDNVELEIYDFTHYEFELEKSDQAIYAEMQNVEEFLKKQYFDKHGKYPPGNIKQEGFRVVTSDKETWNACFEDVVNSSKKEELPKKKNSPPVKNTAFDSLFG